MSLLTLALLVDLVLGGGTVHPYFAVVAIAHIACILISSGSHGRARALVARLAESALMGTFLRVEAFTARKWCSHAIKWAVGALCARKAAIGLSGHLSALSSCGVSISAWWALNRMWHTTEAVLTFRASHTVCVCAARPITICTSCARHIKIVAGSCATGVAWWAISHTVRALWAVVTCITSQTEALGTLVSCLRWHISASVARILTDVHGTNLVALMIALIWAVMARLTVQRI